MKSIVIMGAPGSGKGTQGDKLQLDFNLLKISPGRFCAPKDLINPRHWVKKINAMLDSGKLLSSDIINQLTFEYLEENIHKHSGFLFDGYPRMLDQATYLDKNISRYNSKIDTALLLDVSLEMLIERLQNRYMCQDCGAIYNHKTHLTKVEGVCDVCRSTNFSHRKDDAELDIITTRFKEFQEKTKPVIDYYDNQGILVKIQASGSIDEIYAKIIEIVKPK